MKAIAVHPGTPNSIHLRDVPEPQLDDITDGRGVLVKVLRVGVDGTDKEINAAEYGAAPPGDDYLVTGHESLGVVVEVGKNGVLVLASIAGGDRKVEINSDRINQSFVLGNKVMVGTVNASHAIKVYVQVARVGAA
jgi:threonine dehydrogenase-like Zn-dependent dehydrogenase